MRFKAAGDFFKELIDVLLVGLYSCYFTRLTIEAMTVAGKTLQR